MKTLKNIAITVAAISFVLLIAGGSVLVIGGVDTLAELFPEGFWQSLPDLSDFPDIPDVPDTPQVTFPDELDVGVESSDGITTTWEQTLPADGLESLTLNVDAARVSVTTADIPKIKIILKYNNHGTKLQHSLSLSFQAEDAGAKTINFRRWNDTRWDLFRRNLLGQTLSFPTLAIALPRDYTGTLFLNLNACEIAVNASQVSALDAELNACAGEIKEVGGALRVDCNASSLEIFVAQAGGDINIKGNAGNINLRLPKESSYNINQYCNFSEINIDYRKNDNTAQAHDLTLSGAAMNLTVYQSKND